MFEICNMCQKQFKITGNKNCDECLEKSRIWNTKRRKKFMESGGCLHCGREKENKSSLKCEKCNEYQSKHAKKKREERVKNKLCMGCGSKIEETSKKKHCLVCLEKSKKRRKKRISLGTCPICYSAEIENGKSACRICLNKQKEKRAKSRSDWVENGLCSSCGREREDKNKNYCKKCRGDIKKFSKRRLENGLCAKCSNPKLENSDSCLRCWMISIAYRRIKTGRLAYIIEELWEEQNGICALTGETLIPGVNASLDHIIPVSQGGTDEKENLRWTLKTVNLFRCVESDQDFFALCLKVIQHNLSKIPQDELNSLFSLLKQKLK